MAGELVFTVEPGIARRAQAISLADAGLRERSDLQEWVRENPEILGDGVYIVTFEFGAWRARDGRAADRLDLLGLDDDGRLVVAELKRGPAPDTVEMQAIKYAAFASRSTRRRWPRPTLPTSRGSAAKRCRPRTPWPGSKSTRVANSMRTCSLSRGSRLWRRAFPHR